MACYMVVRMVSLFPATVTVGWRNTQIPMVITVEKSRVNSPIAEQMV